MRNMPNCTEDYNYYDSVVGVHDDCAHEVSAMLMATFVILTMQTGFGMLESGCVSAKNEGNIMMKNCIDVILGGITYWVFGFSMSFGKDPGSSSLFGVGDYFFDPDLGSSIHAGFLFQLAFATTATTIVSGAMAERTSFKAYCLFSLLNTIIYCVPARWLWDHSGFLIQIGAIDIAGSGGVHILGGTSGFFAAWMLGPRQGRYDKGIEPIPLGNPMNCLIGLFVLWWGWLSFNSGSTSKWEFAARAAVNTMIASIGGGIAGSGYALVKSRKGTGKYFEVMDIVNPILGSLVSSTAGCALYHTYDAFIIGFIGGALIIAVSSFTDRLGVDDPVGVTAVHGFGGFWGMMAVGFFAEDDKGLGGIMTGYSGIFRGGSAFLLQAQLFASICIFIWSGVTTCVILWMIGKVTPIRMGYEEEKVGSDFVEHEVRRCSLTGEYIRHAPPASTKLQAVAVIGNEIPPNQCRRRFRESLGKLNRWRKIRIKTFAASMFSNKLRKKRNTDMALASTSNQRFNSEDPNVHFERKRFPTPIFITEDFSHRENFQNYDQEFPEELPRNRHNKF